MQILQVISFLPVLNTQVRSSNLQNNKQLPNNTFARSNMSRSSQISFFGNYGADKDVDPIMIDVNGLLMSSILYGNKIMAETLLASKYIDVNAKIENDNTPLLLALKYKQSIIAEKILTHKDIDVNARDEHGDTALMYALKEGLPKIAEKLLARKDIDVNAKNIYGNTALILATKKGYDDIAESIKKHIETNEVS